MRSSVASFRAPKSPPETALKSRTATRSLNISRMFNPPSKSPGPDLIEERVGDVHQQDCEHRPIYKATYIPDEHGQSAAPKSIDDHGKSVHRRGRVFGGQKKGADQGVSRDQVKERPSVFFRVPQVEEKGSEKNACQEGSGYFPADEPAHD